MRKKKPVLAIASFVFCLCLTGVTAMIEIADPAAAPYFTIEQFGIEHYEIVDQKGNIVVEGETTESVELTDGKASITIPAAALAGGNYKLVITEFVGSSKADQPLVISGNWECEFTR